MKRLALLLPIAALTLAVAARGAAVAPAGEGQADFPGVANPAQARIDYMLKCQGCHQPQGGGDIRHTPPLAGTVARFLSVPGGREFLGRVPGVATTDLDDRRLAQLLNWTLYRFDRENLPVGFKPYSAKEIGGLRKAPLRLERAEMRARLVHGFDRGID